MIDDFGIAAWETLITEVYQSLSSVNVLHHAASFRRWEYIREHFEAHLMVILQNASFCIRKILLR